MTEKPEKADDFLYASMFLLLFFYFFLSLLVLYVFSASSLLVLSVLTLFINNVNIAVYYFTMVCTNKGRDYRGVRAYF